MYHFGPISLTAVSRPRLLSGLCFDIQVGSVLRFGFEVLFWTTIQDCISFWDCGLKPPFDSGLQYFLGSVAVSVCGLAATLHNPVSVLN